MEKIVLVGPSGKGKTSLSKIVAELSLLREDVERISLPEEFPAPNPNLSLFLEDVSFQERD